MADNFNDNQLDLFKEENNLLNKLKKIEIENLSPIDALNILYDLKNDLE